MDEPSKENANPTILSVSQLPTRNQPKQQSRTGPEYRYDAILFPNGGRSWTQAKPSTTWSSDEDCDAESDEEPIDEQEIYGEHCPEPCTVPLPSLRMWSSPPPLHFRVLKALTYLHLTASHDNCADFQSPSVRIFHIVSSVYSHNASIFLIWSGVFSSRLVCLTNTTFTYACDDHAADVSYRSNLEHIGSRTPTYAWPAVCGQSA